MINSLENEKYILKIIRLVVIKYFYTFKLKIFLKNLF